MTTPPSGPPPGPPSGPLSGPAAGPPPEGGPGRRPWWRSGRGLVLLAVVAVAAVAVAVALAVGGNGGGGGGGGGKTEGAALEIVRQPADAAGQNPFTASVSQGSLPTDAPTPATKPSPAGDTLGAPALSGDTPRLYAGRRGTSGCDVGRLIANLTADPAKAKAFAGVVGIEAAGIRSYLHGLTPVLLRADTRVTNHGYRNGSAAAFPSVLQTGTAVLAGPHGLPRLRCACGNPLQPPPAAQRLKQFVLFDPGSGTSFIRPPGTTGDADRAGSSTGGATPTPTRTRTQPPATSAPASSSPSPSTSSPVSSPPAS